MSQLSTSDGQNIGVSASASVLPMNIQGWFPLGWTGLTSFLSKRQDSQECSLVPQFENINFLALSLLYGPALTSIPDYRENRRFDYMDLCPQVMSPCFSMLSRFVIPFLSRRKCLLILWLQSHLQWFGSTRKQNHASLKQPRRSLKNRSQGRFKRVFSSYT